MERMYVYLAFQGRLRRRLRGVKLVVLMMILENISRKLVKTLRAIKKLREKTKRHGTIS